MLRKKSKKGFILFLTLMLMASMGAVSGALIISLTHDLREISISSNNAKAFWLAEAGIADAIKQLRHNDITVNQNSSTNINGSNIGSNTYCAGGGNSYAATLTRPANSNDITISSTGTCNGQSRTVQEIQTVSQGLPYAFNYGIFGSNTNGQTLKIGNTNAAAVRVSGDIFYKASAGVDTVTVNNAAQVTNGVIYADSVTGGGSYTVASGNPNPVPTYPVFTSTSYDGDNTNTFGITKAHSVPNNQDLNLSGGTFDLTQADSYGQTGIHYFDKVTIDGTHIKGPGTIVVDTTALIQGSVANGNAVVDANVNIYAGGSITIGNSNNGVNDTTSAAAGGVIYSQSNIIVRNHSAISSSLLSPANTVRIQKSATLNGIIYADIADIADSVSVNGSVVANKFASNAISNSASITWSSGILPTTTPTGFSGGPNRYAFKANSWQET